MTEDVLRRTTIACAVAMIGAILGVVAPNAAASGAAGCRTGAPAVSVATDPTFQAMVDGYGDDNSLLDDWTGSDGTISVTLPDGRVAWLWSDTFLGLVNADHSRPAGQPFIHNDITLQTGTTLGPTLHGGTTSDPTSLVTPSESGQWYWMGDGTVEGDRLRVLLPRYRRTGPGGFDFQFAGLDVGSWSLPDLAFEGLTAAPRDRTSVYGAAILEDGGYTYLYGVEDLPQHNYVHLARVPTGHLLDRWQYYTGSGWSGDPTTAVRLLDSVATAFGVVKIDGTYVLLTQDTSVPFDGEIVLYTSCHPWGPWGHETHVYDMPENGSKLFTYNAEPHPEFTDQTGMLVSYNVNAWHVGDLLTDVENYRPRFIRVQITFP